MREIFVFFDRQLGYIAEWQQASDKEGFALRLSTERLFHLPAQLGSDDSSFECDEADPAEFMACHSDVDLGRVWKFVRTFRSSPNLKPNIASWIGAVIFAKVTGGKVSILEKASSTRRKSCPAPFERSNATSCRSKTS
jgi:hypothetical protein